MLFGTCQAFLSDDLAGEPGTVRGAFPRPDAADGRRSQNRLVEEESISIRSIDLADDDFADLMPLKKAIGETRVVPLGEQSHGDDRDVLRQAAADSFLARANRFRRSLLGVGLLRWQGDEQSLGRRHADSGSGTTWRFRYLDRGRVAEAAIRICARDAQDVAIPHRDCEVRVAAQADRLAFSGHDGERGGLDYVTIGGGERHRGGAHHTQRGRRRAVVRQVQLYGLTVGESYRSGGLQGGEWVATCADSAAAVNARTHGNWAHFDIASSSC